MRRADIAQMLPDVLRRTATSGSPTAALLAVMEELHRPAEEALAALPDVFDPLRTPDRFVPMLAAWVGLDRLSATPAGRLDSNRLRLVVAMAAQLGRVRGTESGLRQMLEVATGQSGFELVDVGPFRVRLTVPASSAGSRPLIEQIVEQEKPAHLIVDVLVEQAPVAATAEAAS